ncbi:nucleotidyl transferase AbiEii/AbiGii toxin family protein [Endothiovibrio diazotrophicus]
MLSRLWNWLTGASDKLRETPGDYVRPATWEDVVRVVRLLKEHEVEFILVGGYALAAHGYTRMTEDIDIAVAPSPENARRWVLALSHLPDAAAAELTGEEDPFQGDHLHAIRINDEITVDLLPSVCGHAFEELARHAEAVEIGGIDIPVLSLKGLLLTKQGLRDKDRADAALLRRMIESLDDGRDREADR